MFRDIWAKAGEYDSTELNTGFGSFLRSMVKKRPSALLHVLTYRAYICVHIDDAIGIITAFVCNRLHR